MMLQEKDIKNCAMLVAMCERSLRRPLTQGQAVDLIADNYCDDHSEWSLAQCQAMAASLFAGGGPGAFYLAEARNG